MANTTGNSGILNDYTIRPRNLTQYTAFRGITDFSQIGQFAQYEGGYSFLSVIEAPRYLKMLADKDPNGVGSLVKSFIHMLEMEFRGLDGLPDLNADFNTISDGINEVSLINKVTRDTSVTVSMSYFEKTGSLITKFSNYYLTGIKDPYTQAKTYHGLIRDGEMAPGPENEVFTMLYYVTDSTMCRLEKAVLLCNGQLTKAEESIYNGQRSDIGTNKEMTIEFNCYPIQGLEVDKAAWTLLRDITGTQWTSDAGIMQTNKMKVTGATRYNDGNGISRPIAPLDSTDYKFAILNKDNPDRIQSLVDAANNAPKLK